MLGREDNVGFALPFLTGIGVTYLVIKYFCDSYESILNISILSSIFAFTPIIIALIFWKKIRESSKNINVYYLTLIVLMFFFLGVNSYVISELVGSWNGLNEVGNRAEQSRMVINITNKISQIPYKNEESKHIVSSLLIGNKTGLSSQTIGWFRDSGAAHILALSGLHLGLIYGVLKFILGILGGNPWIKKACSIIIIGLAGSYTYWTGASPSLMRAFLFITLRESANIIGRETKGIDIFCTALTIQLLINPQIISSIGFQLSYLAAAGIYFIYPYVKDWYILPIRAILKDDDYNPPTGWRNPMRKIWELISLSTICQLTTLPATWFYFGVFPKYFIITNLIAIPLSSLILVSSMLLVGLGYLGFCPSILLTINEAMIQFLIFCLKTITELP